MNTLCEHDEGYDMRPDPDAVGVTPLPVKTTEKQRKELGYAKKWKRAPRHIVMSCAGTEADWSECDEQER